MQQVHGYLSVERIYLLFKIKKPSSSEWVNFYGLIFEKMEAMWKPLIICI